MTLLPDWQPAPIEVTALSQYDRITRKMVTTMVADVDQALA